MGMACRLASRSFAGSLKPALACQPSKRTSRYCAAMADMSSSQRNETYEKLCSKLKEISALSGISGLLGWDELVMMPSGSAKSRGAQKSALAGVLHDKSTDKELGELLSALRAVSGLDPVQAAVVRDANRDYVKSTAIPKELAQRIASLETDAYHAWVEARSAKDFSKFAPYLQQWVDICKEKARLINPDKAVYDVLLDDFEKGMTTTRLDEIFTQVRDGLKPLIASIKNSPHQVSGTWLNGEYDVDIQAALCRQVAIDLGFDLDKGRLDVSVHPFTGGAHPTDVRMTTRFKANDLMEGLTGAIHETGHALYEQGRNQEYDGLPVNQAMSMGIHESQSLLWERMVTLSPQFCSYLMPLLAKNFGEKFEKATAEQLYEAINEVKTPSFVRVEADEVQYPMHVILRYEIERDLLEGRLVVADVPAAWNAKMTEYLGSAPTDDAVGCLQDVHWSSGAFGYFPTYTLGAMYATQIYAAAKHAIPDLEAKIRAGDFKPLKEWLNEKVHKVGSLHNNGDELMVQVTGSQLDPSIFLAYLKDKYSALYKL